MSDSVNTVAGSNPVLATKNKDMKKGMEKIMEISLEEMLNDLRITNQEIDQLKLENSILGNNYLENKLKIYMNEGRILQREDFVNKLKNIINEKRN